MSKSKAETKASRVGDHTPMMQQYLSVKRQHEDAILLFRMGDFYELFYEDAQTAARVLGLALTSRQKGEKAVPMAGFPHHASESYIRRLIQSGHRVAICEQTEDPALAKGLVDRDVVRIITRGTLTEEALLEEKRNNFLLALTPTERGQVGIAWVDLSTGRFMLEDADAGRLADELARIAPSEVLVADDPDDDALPAEALREATGAAVTLRPPWEFGYQTAHRLLLDHFCVADLDGFGCGELGPAISSAGAVLAYLRETHKGALEHVTSIQHYHPARFVVLDRSTQRSLELVETMRTGQRHGSLLAVLDHTLTAMGGRLLRQWILAPLRSMSEIESRQQGVAELASNAVLRRAVRDRLRDIFDIERLCARISTGRCNARDLLSLARSAAQLPPLREELAGVKCEILKLTRDSIDPLEDVRQTIEAAIVPDAPPTVRDGGIIREGYNAELDELRHVSRHGRSWIAEFEAREIKRTGISTLKVGFNKVFGYYIEVTNVNADKVPADYVRKQTLKNAERYIVQELKDYENKVLSADERSRQLEYDLFQAVRSEVAVEVARVQQTAEAVALIDVLSALAHVAVENGYCRPGLAEDSLLEVEEGRHPVLEQIPMDERFVPNDLHMNGDDARTLIVTGPNMAGKSVYIRQNALIVLMAQMGSFVPAKSAHVGLVDRIFTRVGAGEEQSRGQSTFMVEMLETANIINNATDASLVILDEVGRGTSTFDGVSIAWAVAEYLHGRIGARTLFATHYHEMAQLAEVMDGVKNYNVLVREWNDEIIFVRKVAPGSTDRSYGIHVARLAGLPESVVDRARSILTTLEAHSIDITQRGDLAPQQSKDAPSVRLVQLPLFGIPGSRAMQILKDLDLSNITPMEAMARLQELKEMVEEESPPKRRRRRKR